MRNILLLGRTGGGKSSIGNALLQLDIEDPDAFPIGEGLESMTVNSVACEKRSKLGLYTVVDTPSIMDTRDPDKALKEIARANALCPDGFHVILLVIRIDSRFTVEERMSVQLLEQVFGDIFYKFCIVVFTHGDVVQNSEGKFRSHVAKARGNIGVLNDLLNKCDNRIALVENGSNRQEEVHKTQLEKLQAQINQVIRKNNNTTYSIKDFQLAQEVREQKQNRSANVKCSTVAKNL